MIEDDTLTSPLLQSGDAMTPPKPKSSTVAFWAMGLLNNVPYVIMIAGAKSISEGGTALVFIANVMPGLLVKLTSPYWFDRVHYNQRLAAGSILMALSFILVSLFSYLKEKSALAQSRDDTDGSEFPSNNFYVAMELIGVAFCSVQGSIGEASLLALSGKPDSLLSSNTSEHPMNSYYVVGVEDDNDGGSQMNDIEQELDNTKSKAMCITAFSSGTGLAGIIGFAYVYVFTDVIGISLPSMLLVALIFPVLYWWVYKKHCSSYTMASIRCSDIATYNGEVKSSVNSEETEEMTERTSLSSTTRTQLDNQSASLQLNSISTEETFSDHHPVIPIEIDSTLRSDSQYDETDDESNCNPETSSDTSESSSVSNAGVKNMSALDRLKMTCSLWPYMIPLFTVYAAEYALQSGVWTAIGFPVDDEAARRSFYMKSNWIYQAGVFISRSSGACFTAPMSLLWLMPILQCINVAFFYLVASYQFWYNSFLLMGCFYVGLLGGAVYVHGYIRIKTDLPVEMREFALSTASVADSFGILFADVGGLFIQSCLYKNNGIEGAIVSCPV